MLGADPARGLVLLEDLGDDLFARLCARDPRREPELYAAAVDLLADLQRRPPPGADGGWAPPPYDLAFLLREARLVLEWYLPAATGRAVPDDLAAEYEALAAAALAPVLAAPPVAVLRDYHAENLIWLPGRAGHARVGMLDYQDMLLGHPAYDLVSLLEDARRDTSPALRAAMRARYLAASGAEPEAFGHAAAVLAAQRNLKILGLFTRLARRDGKPRYLGHLPRVWDAPAARPPPPRARAAARLGRPPPAAARGRRCAPGSRPPRDARGGDDLRRRARHPHGRADQGSAEAADRGGGAHPDRPRARRRPRRRRAAGGGEPARPPWADARAPRPRRAGGAALGGAGAARDRRRAEAGAAAAPVPARSSPSTPTWCGAARTRSPRCATPGTAGAWAACSRWCRAPSALGHDGPGDFFLGADGRLARRAGAPAADYVYAGAQILDTAALAAFPAEVFSLNAVWDALIAEGRLFGLPWAGTWVDVGRPAAIALAEAELAR